LFRRQLHCRRVRRRSATAAGTLGGLKELLASYLEVIALFSTGISALSTRLWIGNVDSVGEKSALPPDMCSMLTYPHIHTSGYKQDVNPVG